MTGFLLGLDFGTASARGVLLDAATGDQVATHEHAYRHGTLTERLPGGAMLPPGWALQVPGDYLEAAEAILGRLGRGHDVRSIGLGFTASSPLPARADGTALADLRPEDPHAYVKLWKHAAAQPHADRINAAGGPFLGNFGGKLSGEWLLPKAAQVAAEAPATWAAADRFVEAGDWLAWRLTGREARSESFAAYKAQWSAAAGYPSHLVPGLAARLAPPLPLGSPAGRLTEGWRERTGIEGDATVAVAVIDSHVVLPALGTVEDGTFVGALGTSAVFLYLARAFRPLPPGVEGVAEGAALPGLWCYEAGTASFGDTLAWFAATFPRGASLGEAFEAYTAEALRIAPGEGRLLALDWWNGNRVPHADSALSGLVLGLTGRTGAGAIWRALMEGLCFGTRLVLDLYRDRGFPLGRVVMTSGLAHRSPALVQMLADVLEAPVERPEIPNATAVGAAIHGAVAAGVVDGYAEGAARLARRAATTFRPDPAASAAYRGRYGPYRALTEDPAIRQAMRALAGAGPT